MTHIKPVDELVDGRMVAGEVFWGCHAGNCFLQCMCSGGRNSCCWFGDGAVQSSQCTAEEDADLAALTDSLPTGS